MKLKPQLLIFNLLIITILVAVFISFGVYKGEFLDGLTYASISRNLAVNKGSFFELYYNAYLYPKFYEHPPLFFIIESFFFKLFGDFFWIEKLVGILFFLFSSFIINRIISEKFQLKYNLIITSFYSLFFITYIWVFKNNMLECMLIPFVLLSYYFSIKKSGSIYINGVLASLFFILSFLVKGPFCLFIIGAYFIENCSLTKVAVLKNIRFYTGFFLLLIAAIIVIYSDANAKHFFENYFHVQVIKSLKGARETSSRFIYILNLFYLFIPFIFIVIITLIQKKKVDLLQFKTEWILLLLYSVSILISPKQQAYYAVVISPFIIILFVVLCNNYYLLIQDKLTKSTSVLTIIVILMFILNVLTIYLNYGKTSDKFKKYYTLSTKLEKSKNIQFTFSPDLATKWYLIAILSRFNNSQIVENADYILYIKNKHPLNVSDIDITKDFYLEHKQPIIK